MSNYKHFKHYYNPYNSLDVEWQHVVSKGYLTIGEIICFSGYTKSYIYRLVKNGVIPSLIENDGRKVKWTDFVHWYSHLLETPSSPIGESSFSIYGLMNYTGMVRSWLLSFVERYNIKSYHVGWPTRLAVRTSWMAKTVRLEPASRIRRSLYNMAMCLTWRMAKDQPRSSNSPPPTRWNIASPRGQRLSWRRRSANPSTTS